MSQIDPFAPLYAEEDARRANLHEQAKRRHYLDCLRTVATSPEGVEVLLGVLDHLQFGEPVWAPNAHIHRQAALRDAGDRFMADLAAACPEAHETIMRTMHMRRADNT